MSDLLEPLPRDQAAERRETEAALMVREPSVAMMLQKVIEGGVTADNVGTLEKMMQLYERMEDRKAAMSFHAAFSALQAESRKVIATKAVPDKHGNEKYRYAPYDEIMDQVKPLLKEHGFSVSFDTRFGDGRITAICTLRHAQGHAVSNEFAVRIGSGPPGATESQADGSARSYAKRGALCDALNIVIGHDDDARGLGATISAEKAEELKRRVRDGDVNESRFLKFAGANEFEEIPVARLDELEEILERKERQARSQNG